MLLDNLNAKNLPRAAGGARREDVTNCPPEELKVFERLMFLVEQAHWYYEDFVAGTAQPQDAAPEGLHRADVPQGEGAATTRGERMKLQKVCQLQVQRARRVIILNPGWTRC